MEFNNPHKTVS